MCKYESNETAAHEIHSEKPRINFKKMRTKSGSSFFNSSNTLLDNDHLNSDSISKNYYKTRISSLITNSKAIRYK